MNRNIHVPFLGEERAVTFFSLPDPRANPKSCKVVHGFQTGDIVKAIVTSGKKVGTYVGKVAVRATGSFNITTQKETVQGIGYKQCTTIHKTDGYSYC